jgi:hypothetical protein
MPEAPAQLFTKTLRLPLAVQAGAGRHKQAFIFAASTRHLANEAQNLVEATLTKEVAWFDQRSIAEYIRAHDK